MNYPYLTHETLGPWHTLSAHNPPLPGEGENHVYNGTAECNGMSMPYGTRSVLFFGHMGLGAFQYGDPCTDYADWGHPSILSSGEGFNVVVDPVLYANWNGHGYYSVDPATGYGAEYIPCVWAYDALDLAAVKAGTMQPWEVVPYDVLTLDMPNAAWHSSAPPGSPAPVSFWSMRQTAAVKGVATDVANNRIFVHRSAGENPVIYVYQVTGL